MIVNVTAVPVLEGFVEETTTEVVAALFTVSARPADELAVTFPSPLYNPVMGWEPIPSVFSVMVAVFPVTAALPKDVPPSWKVIVPVASPPYCGATVAVNVTDWW